MSKYISRYAETFAQWDKNSEEDAKRKENNSSSILDYQSLTESDVSKYEKYNAAYRLSRNINYLQEKNPQPFVNVIETFIDEMNNVNLIVSDLCKENALISLLHIYYYYNKKFPDDYPILKKEII